MRINSRGLAHLAPCLRSSADRVPVIASFQCHVHRTICHHARHSSLRQRVPTAFPPVEQYRGAKTKATVKLKDLPQGVVKLESYDDGVDDAPRYPTVVQGHRNNMQKFKNCVILTRVGGFYEVLHGILRCTRYWSNTHLLSSISNKLKNLRHCSA
jgi:hypothetical protein